MARAGTKSTQPLLRKMKANFCLPLISTSVVLASTATFGQGYITFANTLSTRVSVNGVIQAPSPVGSWYYALLVAPSTQNTIDTTDFGGWTYVALATNTGTAGRMSGNNVDSGFAVQINGGTFTGAGGTADFAVVGWSGNIGSDWSSVQAGWHGYGMNATWTIVDPSKPGGFSNAYFVISPVAQDIVLQPLVASYNGIFGPASAGEIPGLNFAPMPEPSNLALLVVLVVAVLVAGKMPVQRSGFQPVANHTRAL
jgi:hypothetical protein